MVFGNYFCVIDKLGKRCNHFYFYEKGVDLWLIFINLLYQHRKYG